METIYTYNASINPERDQLRFIKNSYNRKPNGKRVKLARVVLAEFDMSHLPYEKKDFTSTTDYFDFGPQTSETTVELKVYLADAFNEFYSEKLLQLGLEESNVYMATKQYIV